ncbi:hypothetical protein B0H14DRAFT_2565780 [Mycena olivaceomarginata]|nr:hypothetical protein B0H14DRAFT_2565780 [Mycena olivaceomarginata]
MLTTSRTSPDRRTEEEELADREYDEGGEDDRHSAGVDARQQGLQGGTDTAPDHDGCAAINHIEHEPVKHGAMNRQSVWLRNGPIEPKTSPSLVSQVPDNDLDDDIPPLITQEPSEDGDSANAQDAGVPDLDLPYTVSSVFSQVFRLFNDDQVAGNFCTMFGGSDPGPKYPAIKHCHYALAECHIVIPSILLLLSNNWDLRLRVCATKEDMRKLVNDVLHMLRYGGTVIGKVTANTLWLLDHSVCNPGAGIGMEQEEFFMFNPMSRAESNDGWNRFCKAEVPFAPPIQPAAIFFTPKDFGVCDLRGRCRIQHRPASPGRPRCLIYNNDETLVVREMELMAAEAKHETGKKRWTRVMMNGRMRRMCQKRSFLSFSLHSLQWDTGVRERAADRKKKSEMLSGDWEFVDKPFKALEVLELCTLEFSKKSVPTITKVLPLYKLMEVTLTALATTHKEDEPTLALLAGAAVATKYISNALFGDYVLLGAVHIAFFKGEQWDPSVAIRACQLLLDIVKRYARAGQAISLPDVDAADNFLSTFDPGFLDCGSVSFGTSVPDSGSTFTNPADTFIDLYGLLTFFPDPFGTSDFSIFATVGPSDPLPLLSPPPPDSPPGASPTAEEPAASAQRSCCGLGAKLMKPVS